MFPKIVSRFKTTPITKSQHIIRQFVISSITNIANYIVGFTGGPLLLYYCILSMSMFYQVMGAVRCPKIKKHAGIKLLPLHKAKEPFMPNDMLLYACESEGFTQSIKCLEDGRWSEIPHCPDPTNFTCPDLGPIPHGFHNSSGPPYKVGTVVAFKCENELLPGLASSMIATTTTTTANPETNSMTISNNFTTNSETELLRYNLTGHRLLRCMPSAKWNHPMPTCAPILPEPASNLSYLLTSVLLIIIPILILLTIIQLFIKWRKRQQQRARWKQYFTDYKYRHSKTSITFGMRPQSSNATIPVTDL